MTYQVSVNHGRHSVNKFEFSNKRKALQFARRACGEQIIGTQVTVAQVNDVPEYVWYEDYITSYVCKPGHKVVKIFAALAPEFRNPTTIPMPSA